MPLILKKENMKNIKHLILFVIVISCKAQQIFPLNTNFEEIPQGSYIKDLNNELSPYVG